MCFFFLGEAENYDIALTIVYAKKEKCQISGARRASIEGKEYSDRGWFTAMHTIPTIVNKLYELDVGQKMPRYRTHNPVLLYDNTDWNLPKSQTSYWVDPNREILGLDIDQFGVPTWKVKLLGAPDAHFAKLLPTETLMERHIFRDFDVPYSHFVKDGVKIPVTKNGREPKLEGHVQQQFDAQALSKFLKDPSRESTKMNEFILHKGPALLA